MDGLPLKQAGAGDHRWRGMRIGGNPVLGPSCDSSPHVRFNAEVRDRLCRKPFTRPQAGATDGDPLKTRPGAPMQKHGLARGCAHQVQASALCDRVATGG